MIAASGKSRTITAITLALAVGQTADTSGAPPLAALQSTESVAAPSGPTPQSADSAIALPERVEIHRTEYGVPHILADDLEAMGFGLGYVQSEDYGASIAVAMVTSRGTLARHLGADELDADFAGRAVHARAVETFHRLEPRTRDVYRFEPTDDGRLAANRGDSWVIVVEFGEVPKARTVLAYGQTARLGAPHYADQAAMFAAGKMKEVAWTDEDIRRKSIMVYRPGEEVRR